MVEHWSEKPGVDSSILSLGIFPFVKRPRPTRGFLFYKELVPKTTGFAALTQSKPLAKTDFFGSIRLLTHLQQGKVQVFRFRHTD